MLMNTSDVPGTEAKLHYGPGGFRVLRHGAYVTCAMSGQRIPLDALRYWSAEHQEAYASAQLATERLKP